MYLDRVLLSVRPKMHSRVICVRRQEGLFRRIRRIGLPRAQGVQLAGVRMRGWKVHPQLPGVQQRARLLRRIR